MKHFLLLPLIGVLTFLMSCQNRQSNSKDYSLPPVTNVQAINIHGGARITYALPESDSLQYVKAVYQGADRTQQQVRASFYQTGLTIDGLADTAALNVTLYAVSRSGSLSEPAVVTLHPLAPPARVVAHSLKFEASTGGLRLSFANPTNSDVELTIIGKTPSAEPHRITKYYSSQPRQAYFLHSLAGDSGLVGAFFRDQGNVYSDTVFVRLDSLRRDGISRLKNGVFPIQFGAYDGRRRGTPARWRVNAAAKNRGGYGGVDGVHRPEGGYFSMATNSAKQDSLVNGKIYQTLRLPAGRYCFDGYFREGGNAGVRLSEGSKAYLVVAKGTTLPDVETLDRALGYAPLNEGQVPFTLKEEATVTVGFLARYTRKSDYFRCSSVSLRRISDYKSTQIPTHAQSLRLNLKYRSSYPSQAFQLRFSSEQNVSLEYDDYNKLLLVPKIQRPQKAGTDKNFNACMSYFFKKRRKISINPRAP